MYMIDQILIRLRPNVKTVGVRFLRQRIWAQPITNIAPR